MTGDVTGDMTGDMTGDVTEVEIFWPASLPTESVLAVEDTLTAAGIPTTLRLQPVRRGADLSILVALTTTTLEPVLVSLVKQLGDEALEALQNLVRRLLHLGPRTTTAAPEAVVFENSASGAQFVFTADLPQEAFRRALQLDPGDRPGRWVWDGEHSRWSRFEELQTPEGGSATP